MSRVTDESEESSGQRRNKRYRQSLAERGMKPFQVIAPEETRDLFRKAANLMTRDNDPMDPRAAFRLVGGANEPEPGEASVDLLAELDAARSRITAVEREAEQRRAEIEAEKRQRQTLEAERDAARAGEVAGLAKVQETTSEAMKAARAAQDALRRAEKAETIIRQAKSLPGLKGRLVRWLAGNVLE